MYPVHVEVLGWLCFAYTVCVYVALFAGVGVFVISVEID